jgi:hypothetical protein
MYCVVFITFIKRTGKIVNFEVTNQTVSPVNLKFSDLLYDWSDRFQLPHSTVTVSTVYWFNDITVYLK